jgi:ApaG protein
VDEVTGPGVVGEQPRLQPGDTYEYSSGCPLDTPSGLMFGHYQMETDEGELFDVEIPAFSLDSPGLLRVLN